jgi:hypothetical protein
MIVLPAMMEEHYFRQASLDRRHVRGDSMAQNHYVTKAKRRQKSGKRKDPGAATMATLRKLAAADAKKAGK